MILWLFLPIFVTALRQLQIGGIFDVHDKDLETAFEDAIRFVNQYNEVSEGRSLQLKPIIEVVNANDDFTVSERICSMLESGVAAIFGPARGTSRTYVQSVSDTKEIAHIETEWNLYLGSGSSHLNIYPNPAVLEKAFVDVVQAWRWKNFAILYENSESLLRIGGLLKMYDLKGHTVTVYELVRDPVSGYRRVLNQVKDSGETFFVLDCSLANLNEILVQTQQVGLMSHYHSFIVTNLDLHTIDLTPFKWGGSNITGFSLIDANDPLTMQLTDSFFERFRVSAPSALTGIRFLTTKVALFYDAVILFSESLNQLNNPLLAPKSLSCDLTDSWEHGYSLINYMKTIQIKGITGNIRFDYQGFRSDFSLEVLELTSKKGFNKIGTWNSSDHLRIVRDKVEFQPTSDENTLQNKSFIVLIALTDPYGMLKEATQKLTGNDRYEGFGIDLIHDLSLLLGFNYTFQLQEDNKYGSYNRITKEWDGMIRQLMDDKADLAITDFTITSERESAVDFTMPFMNLGISILYRKPMKEPPSLFSFMSPFSQEVWFYLGSAYLGVSVMLFIMGRIAPAEWNNPYPCIQEPEFLENQFSLRNSLWFTIGSLMQQGSEIAPIAISTRMVAGLWWFFTLIMVSSYTANLAAFLTVESLSSPFKNAEELANQKVIKYGAKIGGSTANFFMDSNYSAYKTIGTYMQKNPDVMMASNPAGVERVEKENYAFFMESSSIEYIVERHCNLTQIGKLLDEKGYGIAMKKNSPYRNILSTGVLKLQESGKLTSLKNKWWKEKRIQERCTSDDSGGEAKELGLANVGGVFVVLFSGVAIGYVITFCELVLTVAKRSYKYNVPFKAELWSELKFVFRFKSNTKKIRFGSRRSSLAQKEPTPSLPAQPPLSHARSKSLNDGDARNGLGAAALEFGTITGAPSSTVFSDRSLRDDFNQRFRGRSSSGQIIDLQN